MKKHAGADSPRGQLIYTKVHLSTVEHKFLRQALYGHQYIFIDSTHTLNPGKSESWGHDNLNDLLGLRFGTVNILVKIRVQTTRLGLGLGLGLGLVLGLYIIRVRCPHVPGILDVILRFSTHVIEFSFWIQFCQPRYKLFVQAFS